MSKKILISAVVALGIVCGLLLHSTSAVKFGSVDQGSDYHATTTPSGAYTALQSSGGTLGSVVILATGTGTITLNDSSGLAGNTGTTTILTIPASLPIGTYVFDAQFYRGLVITTTGTIPTAVVTYR